MTCPFDVASGLALSHFNARDGASDRIDALVRDRKENMTSKALVQSCLFLVHRQRFLPRLAFFFDARRSMLLLPFTTTTAFVCLLLSGTNIAGFVGPLHAPSASPLRRFEARTRPRRRRSVLKAPEFGKGLAAKKDKKAREEKKSAVSFFFFNALFFSLTSTSSSFLLFFFFNISRSRRSPPPSRTRRPRPTSPTPSRSSARTRPTL